MDLSKMQGLMQGIKDIREENTHKMSLEEAIQIGEQGFEAYKAGNYTDAFNLFHEAAENGDALSMYIYSDMLYDIAKDFANEDMKEAFSWYNIGGGSVVDTIGEAFYWRKKAAQEDVVEAMFKLGIMYYRGEGTAPDVAQAFAWCKKAAEEGNVNAMNWVGGFYKDGEGVMQNYIEALRWYERSAHGGNKYAAFNAAYMYDKGEGIEQNKSKAFYWYKAAANAGHDVAMNNLGFAYQNGYGTKSDYVQAAVWYIKAIELGVEAATNNLTDLFKNAPRERRDAIIREVQHRIGNKKAEIAINILSSVKSSESSDCFITTAVCGSFGKPDDCYELMSFRKFRDRWLVKEADGKSLIAEYYEVAPKIVSRINEMSNAKEIYRSIWDNYLKPCLDYIEQGSFAKCKELYVRMVRELKEKY